MYTDNPCADAEAHFDALFAAGEAHDAQQVAEAQRMSRAFIDAAELGAKEPVDKITVGEALYEVAMEAPELLDAFFYRAATQTKDPVMRAMVREVADKWAEIQMRETQA